MYNLYNFNLRFLKIYIECQIKFRNFMYRNYIKILSYSIIIDYHSKESI